MKAMIAVDNYKLETFRRNLRNECFHWEEENFTNGATTVTVFYNQSDFTALHKIIKKSNAQAKK